jgi:RNA polymerase sigma-70 factor (ECF subfamily)
MDTATSRNSERMIPTCGAAGAMEAIVAEHETALLRYAARIVNNPITAQDVVQNVFIKLFQSWREGTHPSDKLKGWLFRVTHNEAVDHIRRESRLRVLHEKQAEEKAAADCPDGIHCGTPEEERRQMVLMHLRALHSREQQVVLLRLDQGLSYEEISAITGRSVGNVGNILHHAVRKLARSMRKGNRE